MTSPATASPADQMPPPAIPTLIPFITAENFRQTLAGLTDPSYQPGDDDSKKREYRDRATDLCVLLCYAFGDKNRGGPLKRTSLWDRIESGLKIAVSKVSDGDTDMLLSLVLDHVHAIGYRRPIQYKAIIGLSLKSPAWRQEWVAYISRHVPAILGHAGLAWEREKEANADAKVIERGYGELSDGTILVQAKDGE